MFFCNSWPHARQRGAHRTPAWALMCLFAMAGSSTTLADVIYVNGAAPGGGNGADWPTAFNTLDAALAVAQNGDQVWIAQGTYVTPAPSGSPFLSSFRVPAGVSLYGGFAGVESDLSQAQPSVHVTVLKGSVPDPAGGGPVVILRNTTATISGFTIRDGLAANYGPSWHGGGGLLIDGGIVSVSHCVFANNSIFHNPDQDYGRGGGLCVTEGASVSVSHCTFDSNSTHKWSWDLLGHRRPLPGQGGAIYVDSSTLSVTRSTFIDNRGGGTNATCEAGSSNSPGAAASGGAIYASASTLTISSCAFSGNSAGSSHGVICGLPDPVFPFTTPGGAAGQGGAIYLSGGTTAISRTVFQGNSAGASDIGSGCGGAIYAAGSMSVANCRFLGNSAGNGVDSGDAGDGGGVYSNASAFFVNCEFTGNRAGVGNSTSSPAGRDGVGGAICALGTNSFDNCTIAKNQARGQGAGTYGADLANSIVFFNDSTLLGQSLDAQMVGGTAFYSNVQGWIPSVYDPTYRNSNTDPQFQDVLGPDGIAGTLDDNTRLTERSAAIDSANWLRYSLDLGNMGLSSFANVDLDDSARVVDDPNVPNTSFIAPLDRGAYEFKPGCVGDLNGDGQVDDADFVFFTAAYNLLDCADPAMPAGCAADFNKDDAVNDADFVIFAAAYDQLLCS